MSMRQQILKLIPKSQYVNTEQKLAKLKAIEEINKKIGGCFGDADKIFAGHPLDEERAKKYRKMASQNHINLEEMQNIIAGYLFRTGFPPEHCKEQMVKASKFFNKKLT